MKKNRKMNRFRNKLAGVVALALVLTALPVAAQSSGMSDNLLVNGGFELYDEAAAGGFPGWDKVENYESAQVEGHEGKAAYLTARDQTWSGPHQYIEVSDAAYNLYYVSAWVKTDEGKTEKARISLDLRNYIEETGAYEKVPNNNGYATANVEIGAEWTHLEGYLYLNHVEGEFNRLKPYIGTDGTENLYIDEFEVRQVGEEGNLVVNTGFEAGGYEDAKREWILSECTISQSSEQAHSGNYSALASGRKATWGGIQQFIYKDISPRKSYEYSVWVRMKEGEDRAKVEFDFRLGSEKARTLATSMVEVNSQGWTQLSGIIEAAFDEEVDRVKIYVSTEGTGDVYVDDFFFAEKVWTPEIINPGFEDGTAGWQFHYPPDGTADYTHWTVSEDDAHSGEKCIASNPEAEGADACQMYQMDIRVNQNTWYEFSFYGKFEGAGVVKVRNQADGSTLGEELGLSATSGRWKKHTIVFNSADAEKLRLYIGHGDSGINYFDDFNIKPLEEIKISRFRFSGSEGEETASLEVGQWAAAVTVANPTDQNVEATIMYALYENNALKDICTVPFTSQPGTTVVKTNPLTISSEECRVKVMLWKDLVSLQCLDDVLVR